MQARVEADLGVTDVLRRHRRGVLDDHPLEVFRRAHGAAHLAIDGEKAGKVPVEIWRRRGEPMPGGQLRCRPVTNRALQVDV